MTPRRHAAGFSLIELMVTVGIIAILAAIAFPSYRNHVIKTRRAAAEACLLEMSQYMERHRTTTMAYNGDVSASTPMSNDTRVDFGCELESDDFYTFAIAALDATTYSLTATPVAGSAQAKDTKCGTLGLDQAGTKSETGSAEPEDCW